MNRWLAAAVAACLVGVAACSVATTTATPTATLDRSPLSATTVSTPSQTAATAISPEPSPSDTLNSGRIGLGTEITAERLDPEFSDTVQEFVSDGVSLLLTSRMADDVGPDGVPDLWRFTPGQKSPELLWRNPERNHTIVKLVGDVGEIGFVDMPVTGERAWNLWFLPRHADELILLDQHPGDEDVPSAVPSFVVQEGTIVWTAFDRGPAGPVSQLLIAQAPGWEPRVVRELPSSDAEFWFPSLLGPELVYVEAHYSADRTSDERRLFLASLMALDQEPRRLDKSGRATMPLVTQSGILWKEADPGFSMFNWGKMYRYDRETGSVSTLDTSPQEYVNYPSAGGRFVAWEGENFTRFGVYDLVRDEARMIERHPQDGAVWILRPHIHGDLIVWLHINPSISGSMGEIRYATLPHAAADRPGAP